MQDFIPLFPLQLVVFPGERLNLHIFEPRYRQLIRECKTNGITFGIPLFHNGKLMDIGTEMKLIGIEKRYASGELDIKTQGLGKFRIEKFFKEAPGKLYGGGDISRLNDSDERDIHITKILIEKIDRLFVVLDINIEYEKDLQQFNTYSIAQKIGLTTLEAYQLLILEREEDRQAYMLAHLNRIIPKFEELAELKRRAKLNGHFKNIIPPKL